MRNSPLSLCIPLLTQIIASLKICMTLLWLRQHCTQLVRWRIASHFPAVANPGSSDSSSNESESDEDNAMEELEVKKKHPYRLHPELWFNDPGEVSTRAPERRCDLCVHEWQRLGGSSSVGTAPLLQHSVLSYEKWAARAAPRGYPFWADVGPISCVARNRSCKNFS